MAINNAPHHADYPRAPYGQYTGSSGSASSGSGSSGSGSSGSGSSGSDATANLDPQVAKALEEAANVIRED
ncbi:hypothetical protein AB0C84_07825 [Actinomadura sp. NPDC048955]|uniref:hypothetical protein n=1 Tax=Actinomadura sp. NPDC048955 TaxID=3158228 RepID=UPI0033EB3354